MKKAGGVFFVTIFLQESIPVVMTDRLQEELQKKLENIPNDSYDKVSQSNTIRRRFFKKQDDLLHALAFGSSKLTADGQIENLASYLENLNSNVCNTIAYSIMNNHIHLCIATSENAEAIVQKIQYETSILLGNTDIWSTHANLIPLQDRDELAAVMDFLVREPIERELSTSKMEWKGTFVRDKYFKLLKRKKTPQ